MKQERSNIKSQESKIYVRNNLPFDPHTSIKLDIDARIQFGSYLSESNSENTYSISTQVFQLQMI